MEIYLFFFHNNLGVSVSSEFQEADNNFFWWFNEKNNFLYNINNFSMSYEEGYFYHNIKQLYIK